MNATTSHMTIRSRRGATITEFVVACSLLGSMMLVIVPAAIRIGRVQQAIRQDRIALDEIMNRMDRLTQLSLHQLNHEIDRLTPSEFAMSGLPDPKLSGSLQNSEEGYRLALDISWNRPGRRESPLTMATWIYPASIPQSLGEDAAP